MMQPNNSTPDDLDQGQSGKTLDLDKVLYECQKWNSEQGIWVKYGPPITGKTEAISVLNRQKKMFKKVPDSHWRVLPKVVCDHYREALRHAKSAQRNTLNRLWNAS